MVAAENNYLSIMKGLLSSGARVNEQDKLGEFYSIKIILSLQF